MCRKVLMAASNASETISGVYKLEICDTYHVTSFVQTVNLILKRRQ